MSHREFKLQVSELDVREGHHTIWVNAPDGTTMLRIKCTGRVVIEDACSSPVAHADMMIRGNIHICIPEGVKPVES